MNVTVEDLTILITDLCRHIGIDHPRPDLAFGRNTIRARLTERERQTRSLTEAWLRVGEYLDAVSEAERNGANPGDLIATQDYDEGFGTGIAVLLRSDLERVLLLMHLVSADPPVRAA